MCGEMFVDRDGEPLDTSDPDWVRSCSTRFKHYGRDRPKAKPVKLTVKHMSAQQFVNYCEGTFSTSELATLREKCIKERNFTLLNLYTK